MTNDLRERVARARAAYDDHQDIASHQEPDATTEYIAALEAAIAEMGGTTPDNVQESARVLLGDDFDSPMLEALDPFNNDQDVAQDVLDALRALAELKGERQ